MISKLPWRLDEDGDKIYDDDDNVIAEDGKFFHVDDFEAIPQLIEDKKKLKYRIVDE